LINLIRESPQSKKSIFIGYLVKKYENHSMTSSYDTKSDKDSGGIL